MSEQIEVWKWTSSGMVADPEYINYSKKGFVRLSTVNVLNDNYGDMCIKYRQLQVNHQIERDALKAENNVLDVLCEQRFNEIAGLQSELTKARELLADALGSVHVDAGRCENTQVFKQTTQLAEAIELFLAHQQSAPAAKCKSLSHKFMGGKCSVCGLVMYALAAKGDE